MKRLKGSLFCVAALVLAACTETEIILPGERVAIRAPQTETILRIDPVASAEGGVLAAAKINPAFAMPGGNANHGGGHFDVALPLEREFQVNLSQYPADEGTEIAQPVIGADAVFTVTPGGFVVASSAGSGLRVWGVDIDPSDDRTQPSVTGGMALAGDSLIVHAGKARLLSLNADDGSEQWAVDLPQHIIGGPSVANGVIVVTDVTGRIYALAQNTGEELWNRIGSQSQTRIAGAANPAIYDDQVIVAGGDGELLSLNLFDGRFNWGDNLVPSSIATALDSISDITAHPIHDGERVYAITQSGIMVAYTASVGRVLWDLPLRSLNMPWLAGETLYISTLNNELFAVRRTDGAVRWRADLPGKYDADISVESNQPGRRIRHTGPVVVSGAVVVANNRGEILLHDAATGERIERMDVGGSMTTALSVAHGRLYAIDRRARLRAWD